MFKKLYGETEEMQLEYLSKKLKTTLMLSPLILFGIGILIIFYMWGWDFIRSYSGIATFSALLSRNIALAVIIVIAFLLIGYLLGFINLLLGILRFISLKSKQKEVKP